MNDPWEGVKELRRQREQESAQKEAQKKTRRSIPQSVRFNVFRRDNFTCVYCGRSSPEVVLHCDHAKSFKDGGACTEENLVTACEECNSGKSSKSVAPRIATPSSVNTGLVGMWGHTHHPGDHQFAGEINWQFKVLRPVSDGAYICQLFSWMSGDPTDCKVITTDELINNCKLYASNQSMNDAYYLYCEKESRRRDQERSVPVARYKWPTNQLN